MTRTGMALALLLGAACSQRAPAASTPRGVHVRARLPFSGILQPLGVALREGLEEGLREAPDSVRWTWTWSDNGGSSEKTAALPSASDSTSLELWGIGGALQGIHPDSSSPLALWLGDGDRPAAVDSSLWNLWPSNARAGQFLYAWIRSAPRPLAILYPASASWAPVVTEELQPLLGNDTTLRFIPHDVDESTWRRETEALIALRPASVLLWQSPHETRTLLEISDLQPLRDNAQWLHPRLEKRPRLEHGQSWSPVWQPSYPPTAPEISFYRLYGRLLGQTLARTRLPDSLHSARQWREALGRTTLPAGMEAQPGGWAPVLKVE